MSEDVLDLPREGADHDDDWWPADDDDVDCTICAGEGWTDCDDPIQCMAPEHTAMGLCPCLACGGSGLGIDQTVW